MSVSMTCRFCDKTMTARNKVTAWHRITGHEFGKHITEKKKGPDSPAWIDHPHGSWGRYKKGCRCDECRRAASAARKAYRAKVRDSQRR